MNELHRALGGEIANGGIQLLCPGPDHSAEDRSLSIKLDAEAPNGFIVFSFAGDDVMGCRDYVRRKLGLPEFQPKSKAKPKTKTNWTLLSEHVYRTASGEPFLRVRKCLDEKGQKQYPQSHWDGERWIKGKPAGAKIPYRLPQLIAAPLTTTIYFCEGEKDADNLAMLDFVATTQSEGAAAKWDPALTPHFKDRCVVVLPDADKPGRKHAEKVAKAISDVAASVKIVDLYPDRRNGSDVSNWLEDDTAGVRLVELIAAASVWEPSADDDQVIAELAASSRLQYARRRKEAADQLGITVAELDKIVGAQRSRESEADEPALFPHWQVDPWEEPVDGNALLHALVEKIKRHVVMSPDQTSAVALWVMLTWIHDIAAVHSPLLLVTSAEANSGKSTLMGVVGFLARRSLLSVSISGPALFRSIEKWRPTFVIDEADTVIANNDDLKEVVNSGWTRGQSVIRCDPDTNEPRPYSTFAPKAVGMKGRKLPDTTLSRAIVVEMKRKRPQEAATDFDHVDDPEFSNLRRQLLRWADDNAAALFRATPEVPRGFHNRTRANWRPLLAIAERAGDGWKRQAWQAAAAIEKVKATFESSIGVKLLEAIRVMFETNVDCLLSKDIIASLIADPEQPWGDYRHGKSITQKQLAGLLGNYQIYSGTVHPAGVAHGKGYKRQQFEEAFDRYLTLSPDIPASEACKRASADDTGTSEENRSVRKEAPHASKSDDLAHSRNGLHACTLERPEIPERGCVDLEVEESNGCLAPNLEPTSGNAKPSPITLATNSTLDPAKVVTVKTEEADDIPAFLRRCVQCGAPGDATSDVALREARGTTDWLHAQCAGFRENHPELWQ